MKNTKNTINIALAAFLLTLSCLTGCAGNSQGQDKPQQETGSQEEISTEQTVTGADTAADKMQQPYTFVDALEQEITVENPERVVSLMGSFTEIWLLAGGEDSLVGTSVDPTDNRELGIPEGVANVGTYQDPNLEAILALEPDLILLSADTVQTDNHVAMKDTLAAAQIPAAYFRVTHFEDYLKMLKICTDITGDRQAYEKNGAAVEQKIQQILAENTREDAPSFLLLITYSGGIRPQGSSSMTGQMLTQLGCHNIIDDYPSLLKEFSIEQVIEIDPDYIFVIPMGNDDEATRKNLQENIESNPAWNGLTAVQKEQYILLPREQFLYKPNAKWADSYQYLADLLAKQP